MPVSGRRVNRRLRLVLLGVVAVLGTVFVLAPVGPSPAGADETAELSDLGWWNKLNGGVVTGLPVAPPAAPPKVALDPSASAGSIQLAADASGPSAVGALRYDSVPDGSTITLVLKSNRPLPPAEFFTLVLCTAATPWVGADNGDWAQRPSWTSNCSTPAVNSDTLTWNLDSSFVDAGLSMVLVPTATIAYQVTLNAPDASALTYSAPPAENPTTETTMAPEPEPEPVTTSPVVTTPIVTTPLVSTPPVSTAPVVRPRPTVPFRPAPTSNVPAPFKDLTRGERIMAVSLLLGLLAAWWWVGGQPVRNPRLLGSVASPAPAAGLAMSEAAGSGGEVQHVTTVARMGGVGRFAKLRTTAPRRL